MEENKHIQTLFAKYLRNEASEAEIETLYDYFQAAEHEKALKEHLLHEIEKESTPDHHLAERAQKLAERVETRLLEDSAIAPRPINKTINYWIKYGAVAALIIAVAWMAIFIYDGAPTFKSTRNESSHRQAHHIVPGNGQITLTLPDGSALNLDAAQSGIRLDPNGTLMYLDGVTPVQANGLDWTTSDPKNIQTLSTASGGMYSLALSDSTRVWLNSGTTLRFPARFSAGSDRVVELDGEAYFDVASHPEGTKFIVKTQNHTIEVTGTEFNVHAYGDEVEAHTTLLEGVVHIRQQRAAGPSNSQVEVFTLSPGEQAIVDQNKTRVSKVDPETFTAWKDGKFSFEGKTLATVSREIARWYDLDIRFEGINPLKLQSKLFGEADRDQDITFFLKLVEAGGFDYQLDDRVLTIKRKEENRNP